MMNIYIYISYYIILYYIILYYIILYYIIFMYNISRCLFQVSCVETGGRLGHRADEVQLQGDLRRKQPIEKISFGMDR